MELPAEAIASLRKYNVLTLRNPQQDFFKVKNFYLEASLRDGTSVTTRLVTAVFTQPSGWKYAEGVKSEFGTDIEIHLAF